MQLPYVLMRGSVKGNVTGAQQGRDTEQLLQQTRLQLPSLTRKLDRRFHAEAGGS